MTKSRGESAGGASARRATSHQAQDASEVAVSDSDIEDLPAVTGRRYSIGSRHSVSSRHSRNERRHSKGSVDYDIPDSYRNLDEINTEAPIQNPDEPPLRRRVSREDSFGAQAQQRSDIATVSSNSPARERRLSQISSRHPPHLSQRRASVSRVNYDVPDSYMNVAESAVTGPIQNPDEAVLYRHQTLEQSRSRDQVYIREQRQRRASVAAGEAPSPPEDVVEDEEGPIIKVSRLATQVYTISYLIVFSIFGTLARLGLQTLTSYPGAPVIFSSVWPNFAGSVVFGFLAEDRMLFRFEWGTPTYELQIMRHRQHVKDEETPADSSNSGRNLDVDLTAARKAHMATKKTIPLYIGLATGFCGSFTSYSAFVRDIFLALSNDLPTPGVAGSTMPRNGGDSFMALLAVTLTTVALCLSGLFIGAHLAIVLEPITPSLPFMLTRKVFDRLSVFVAFGLWLGAVLLAILPPDRFSNPGASELWRGRAVFALVFAPLGTLGRFYASLYLNGRIAAFPLGTFFVNVFGTAVLGTTWDIQRIPAGGVIGCQVLQGIEDGFCGCFTTVSTWVAELAALRRRNAYVYGSASVLCALALLIAIMGGMRWSDGWADIVCVK